MRDWIKPNVFISACIEFESCRYDGEKITDEYIKRLLPFINVTRVCPELAIGLGAPRESIRLVERKNESRKLLATNSGNDYTEQMNDFSKRYVEKLLSKEMDGFILKAKSPTCGLYSAKVYYDIGKSHVKTAKEAGVFGQEIITKFPSLPKETERRLSNYNIRDRFFTEIFTIASFRQINTEKKMKDLVKYHSDNKYLFMTYNQNTVKKLGNIVANHNKLPNLEVFELYKENLYNLFQSEPLKRKRINILEHMYGYFKTKISIEEKDYYFSIQKQYLNGQVPYSNVLTVIHGWSIRFKEDYLLNQTIFEPYPRDLNMVTDSGKNI